MKRRLLFALLAVPFLFAACTYNVLTPYYLDGTHVPNADFVLYSADTGVYPDASILDDPNNFYRECVISQDYRWVAVGKGADYAADAFYCWATILAREGGGEAQFYTANCLKLIYTDTGAAAILAQALRAYQAILDNFATAITDTTGNGDMASIGIWAYDAICTLGGVPRGWVKVRAVDEAGNALVDELGDPVYALVESDAEGGIFSL